MPTEREQQIAELWADVAMPVQNVILNANLAAREIVRHRDRASWLEVGRGRVEIRDEALRRARTQHIQHPTYRSFHGMLMSKAPDLAALEEHDHAGCQHALWMFENWHLVESWLAGLPGGLAETNRLNHPSAIRRRYDAAHKRQPQGLEKPPTATARKEMRIDELEAEVRELQTQLRQREYEPPAPPAAAKSDPAAELTPTQKQRYDAALRKAEKRLREEITAKVTAEIEAAYDAMMARVKVRLDRANKIIASHKGIISSQNFRKLLGALHPDQNSYEHAREMFEFINGLKNVLVKEEPPVINAPPLPKNTAELKAQGEAKRGAKLRRRGAKP